jgi:hypothetical protein
MAQAISASTQSALRLRAGVGMAGMFVVASFGAALFFSASQTQAAEGEQVVQAASPAIEQVAAR